MKRIMKSRIFTFILGAIIFGGIGVYATKEYNASQITYNKNGQATVDAALNDLYSKASSNKTATQVATLTEQGATYTMQNDGYITGIAATANTSVATLQCDSKTYILTNESYDGTRDVSVYAPKDTVVTTRSNGGTYNLTVYEWK